MNSGIPDIDKKSRLFGNISKLASVAGERDVALM